MNEKEIQKNSVGYVVGDYVNIKVSKVCDDVFRGRIVKFLYKGKNDTVPTQALVEVCNISKKSNEVTKSQMPVAISSLSPLL